MPGLGRSRLLPGRQRPRQPLLANPYDGAPFPGYPADDASTHTARHAAAIPKMTEHLADAAHQLDLSATGCHYVAAGITRDRR